MLKQSSSEIIKNSTKTYNEYFLHILMLLRASKKENDIAWQGAKKLIKLDKAEIHYTQNGFIEHKNMDSSQKFINLDSLQEISKCEDDLEAISFQVELILKQFQNLVEKQDLWRMFWTKGNNKDSHVQEFYSQMLFMLFVILG